MSCRSVPAIVMLIPPLWQRSRHGMDITKPVNRNNCAHALFYVRAVLQRTIMLPPSHLPVLAVAWAFDRLVKTVGFCAGVAVNVDVAFGPSQSASPADSAIESFDYPCRRQYYLLFNW